MTKSKTEHSASDEIADPLLYRTYWSLMMKDALEYWEHPITEENKLILHEFHKRILGYKGISGRSQEIVSRFLFEVVCYYAVEHGVFIRTSKKQMRGIEWLPLGQVWKLL